LIRGAILESSGLEIYLDNNATTQVHPKACAAMLNVMGEGYGNPSSAHRAGEKTRRALFVARSNVAELFGCLPENVVFGSGATELNNWILNGLCNNPDAHLITTTVEHPSILRAAAQIEQKGGKVTYLPVDSNGLINLEDLEDSISSRTALVSVQWINGETGVIQDVKSIASICASAKVKLHCDSAQAFGKININISEVRVDFLTCSAHKLHGPTGVGAAYCRQFSGLRPLIAGGSQEFGLRAGTENIPGIVGFGVSAQLRREDFTNINKQVQELRDRFESAIQTNIPAARVNGTFGYRSHNTSNICFEGIDGQALIAILDRLGLRCSQSSACSSQIPEPSHVLIAMGLSERDAYSSVRFSMSQLNTQKEIDAAAELVTKRVMKLRETKVGINA